MSKIFITTPALGGKTNIQYAISLAETYHHLKISGHDAVIKISNSGSLLCAERNRLLMEFLRSNCTHILCIDADLGWPSIAVTEMLKHDEPFVAGLYPSRRENLFLYRPAKLENEALVTHESKKLIQMECIPAGFMLIQRHVIEKMMKDRPQDKFNPKNSSDGGSYALFNTEICDGEFWGEDYIFCNKVRESGFDIWIDPLIQFSHDETVGMFAELLSNDPEGKSKVLNQSQHQSHAE